jgi:ATP-dependent protease HslVU (ClpYQ) peptidase subunit
MGGRFGSRVEGGATVVRGNVGRVKSLGRYGTIAAVLGTFATSYTLTAMARCAVR